MRTTKKIWNEIQKYNTIMIHGHGRPDGDCLGSQFGLKDLIQQSFPEKKVYVVGQTSDYVSFLGTPDIVTDEMYQGSLAIVVDVATIERVSDQRFTLADKVIKIDHHIAIEDFGDISYVIDTAPACAYMIANFYLEMKKEGAKLSSLGAEALYTGIITDTGRFRYEGITKEVYQTVGELIALGVRYSYIDQKLSIETIESIHLKGYVLNHIESTEHGVAYFIMSRDIIEQYHVSDETAAAMVSCMSNIEGYPVWFLLIEYPTEFRLRVRSRGPEIASLCNNYSGGGHAFAAGAKLPSLEDLPRFLTDMDNLVQQYKETK